VVTYQVIPGLFTNVAAVEALIVGTDTVVGDDDPNSHRGPGPAIRVEKAINTVDPISPTTLEDADKGPGPELVVNMEVFWTYQVLNNGDTTLEITDFVDDFGTDRTGDDFTPRPILGGDIFNLGDANKNNVFDPGETWLFTSEGVQDYKVKTGLYVNRIDVVAQAPDNTTVTDSDLNHHLGVGARNAEGLTPGFWKTNAANNDAVAWPRNAMGTLIYDPSDTLESIFDIPDALDFDDVTLVEALNFGGAFEQALLRHAVAGLLNATHLNVAYPLTAPQLIQAVNAALASGDASEVEGLKDELDVFNSLEANLDQHGETDDDTKGKGNQLVAVVGSETQLGAMLLPAEQLASIVDEARARWADAVVFDAATSAQLDAVRFEVTDLLDKVLGETIGNTILLDSTAAGHGWFIDSTPGDDQEFLRPIGEAAFQATPSSAAFGRIDLLTAVMHEFGHILGFSHDDSQEGDAVTLMASSLDPGVRQTGLPTASPAGQALAEPLPTETANTSRPEAPSGDPAFASASEQQVEFLVGLPEEGPSCRVPSAPMARAEAPWTDEAFDRFLDTKRTQRQLNVPDEVGLAQQPEWVATFLQEGNGVDADLTEEITVVLT
jgi:hypothetical protein